MSETNWSKIVTGDEIKAVAKVRKVSYIEKKIWETSLPEEEADGWYKFAETNKVNKTGTKMIKVRQDKSYFDAFEDEVWTMFYKMGFNRMNSDRKFTIYYDEDSKFSQQIDVFAADDETVLIVECKTVDEKKHKTFKQEIGSFGGNRELIQKVVMSRPEYSGKKFKMIWATKGITLDANDVERLDGYGIAYFDDDVIQYYTKLADYIGTAARYQLLGDIFRNTKIAGLDMRVPAIQGTMGGMQYYEFSIEPEKLLKIGYVLHQTMPSSGSMQSYQRLVQKNRLTEIRKFVNKGGYFPNSIIISVDAGKSGLQFDVSSLQVEGAHSKIGVLHLPQKYQSAYIIDGQHRLYGYSESDYAKTNTVPVVAFVNMEPEEQMKMFMDINEKQKSVPKQIMVVLNGEILWASNNPTKQREAIRSRISQQLGANQRSPLHNRILLLESDTSTDEKCITLPAMQQAIKATKFLSVFDSSGKITSAGMLDTGDKKDTYSRLYKFLSDSLKHICEKCPDEWDAGKNGIITMNRGIQGVIRVIGDITDYLIKEEKINPLKDASEDMYPEIWYYLDVLCDYFNSVSEKDRSDLMKYGSGADKKFWRTYQYVIHKKCPEFNPEGLEEFIQDETQQFNKNTRDYVFDIEAVLKERTKRVLQDTFGGEWLLRGLPIKLYNKATDSASHKNTAIALGKEDGPTVDAWDFVTMENIADIAVYGQNWSTIFESMFVRPEDKGQPGDKKAKVKWITDVQSQKNKLLGTNGGTYSVPKADFENIQRIHAWLCE